MRRGRSHAGVWGHLQGDAVTPSGRAMQEVLGGLDFETRTHLNTIQGFSELLADPATVIPDARRWEYAEIIRASSEELGRLSAQVIALLHMGVRD
jgi:signal transduction histidine kinase